MQIYAQTESDKINNEHDSNINSDLFANALNFLNKWVFFYKKNSLLPYLVIYLK
jgi:hypothetical protein